MGFRNWETMLGFGLDSVVDACIRTEIYHTLI